jgi:NADPH:quinone reductase-like Zn-dependent oxidoreductase
MESLTVVITARERAELIAEQLPELAAGEVRGKTLATLISAGTEINWNFTGDSFPNYPGYASVFQVDEVGPGVDAGVIGSVRLCFGTHRSAQQTALGETAEVPAGLAPEAATIARLMGVTMTSLTTSQAKPGELVLVTGGGPIGFCALQNFKRAGYQVALLEPDAERRAWASEAGVQLVFGSAAEAAPLIGGRVALALECSSHEQAMLDACGLMRRAGELVQVGTPWHQRAEQSAFALLKAIFFGYLTVRGGWEWALPMHENELQPVSLWSNLRAALSWLAEGSIAGPQFIVKRNPADIQPLYEALRDARAEGLLQVLDWSQVG